MNKVLTSVLIILFSSALLAQTVDTDTLKRRPRKELAFERIMKLKEDGAIFVRLKTRNMTAEALEKVGKEAEAGKVRFKQAQENKILALSFASTFDFCPVYFFYSDDSDHFRSGAFDQIQYVNENLDPIQPEIKENYALGAEIGRVNTDEGNSEIDLYSILILDEDLFQLNRPFPFYVPISSVDKKFLSEPIGASVARLNDKLEKFLKRAEKKTSKWKAREARKKAKKG